jgi:hypothetical protein
MRIVVKTNFNTIFSSLTDTIESLQVGKDNYDGVIRTVATTSLAQIRRRIHEEGKASDGNDIGQYSNKPLYVSIKANPGRSFGAPTGKTGRSVFASGAKEGQSHTSKYFGAGYDEFKTSIGRNQLKKVNLFLSGTLANQFLVIDTANGYGLGWQNAEKFEIAKGMEKKYGKKIYALTEDEKKLATEVAVNYLFDVFNK